MKDKIKKLLKDYEEANKAAYERMDQSGANYCPYCQEISLYSEPETLIKGLKQLLKDGEK